MMWSGFCSETRGLIVGRRSAMRARLAEGVTPAEQEAVVGTVRNSTAASLVRRCQAIVLSAAGQPVPAMARLMGVDASTIHRWLDRFETGGIGALLTTWSTGRPPRWDEAYELLLVETARHDPRWYGREQSSWTCSLLAGYLAERTGIRRSAERVRVLLHQHGIRLKQPTPVVHSPDPGYPLAGVDPKGAGGAGSRH
jgi:transposase